MAAFAHNKNNNKISKTESQGPSSGQHSCSGSPCSSNNTSRQQENNNNSNSNCQESMSDRRFREQTREVQSSNHRMLPRNAQNTPVNFINYPIFNANSQYFQRAWSNSYQGFVPQQLGTPLFYRSFSDSRIQQQHFNTIYLGRDRSYNRNVMPRSNSSGPTNWTKVAERDRRYMWDIRKWQQTALGKKLSKQKHNPKSFTFTLMSYNVLAQELLTEHPYLYHRHHPRALRWDERWKNLLMEIKYHNADILCLQEVQESHLQNFYNELESLGYTGLFKQRTGIRTDGCAIYYKTSTFNLIEHITVEFNQTNIPVLNRDNIAIIAKFAPKNDLQNEFVVATTHLLYNPRREDVRLAQTQVLLSEIDRVAFNKCNVTGSYTHAPIIITGDFNLTPDSPVYKFLINGMLKYEHLANRSLQSTNNSSITGKLLLPSSLGITDDCKHAELMEQRKENIMLSREQELEHINLDHSERKNKIKNKTSNKSPFSTGTLTHDLALKSAYNHRYGENFEATTYQDKWVTVDYIFYSGIREENNAIKDDKLTLLSRYAIPTAEELQGVTIPNFAVGSDHLSLVVKFQLNY